MCVYTHTNKHNYIICVSARQVSSHLNRKEGKKIILSRDTPGLVCVCVCVFVCVCIHMRVILRRAEDGGDEGDEGGEREREREGDRLTEQE